MNSNLLLRSSATGASAAAAVFITLLLGQAWADSPAVPTDYTKVTEDSRHVFVMLAPSYFSRQDSPLRQKYGRSGLYKNNGSTFVPSDLSPRPRTGLSKIGGSTTPLWTIDDWFAWSVIPVSDGQHLIRLGPWAESLQDEAVSFFKNGQLIKSYSIGDLVENDRILKRSVSHFFWKDRVEYIEETGTLTIITKDGREYTFSITTGEIIRRSGGDVPMWLIIVGIFVLLFTVRRYLRHRAERGR